jgi:alpha-tubulin suppressor-like RCC1 family protein
MMRVVFVVLLLCCAGYCAPLFPLLWGTNSQAQLGTGNTAYVVTPFVLYPCANITTASCQVRKAFVGYEPASFIVTASNELWSTGYNLYGALGTGNAVSRTKFAPIATPNLLEGKIISDVVGLGYFIYILAEGKLYGMGYSNSMGLGTIPNQLKPALILSNITMVSSGYYFAVAVDVSNNVWAFGYNVAGCVLYGGPQYVTTPFIQNTATLGNRTIKAIASNVQCSTFLLCTDNTLWSRGADGVSTGTGNGPAAPYALVMTNVANIATGNQHSVILATNGSVYVIGTNAYGQLCLPSGVTAPRPTLLNLANTIIGNKKIIAVYATYQNTFLIDADYILYGCGLNTDNQITFSDANNKYEPTLVSITMPSRFTYSTTPYTYPRPADATTGIGLPFLWVSNCENGVIIDPYSCMRIWLDWYNMQHTTC